MEINEHIDGLRRDGKLMADAIGRAGPDAAVPTCPDWQVRDLARHASGIHRWATMHVRDALTEGITAADLEELVGPWPPDDELVDWFAAGHQALVDALESAPSDLQCWTFLKAPSPLAFWARRQAHETAIHRVDAERASGPATPFPADFAADGIDEVLTCFVTRGRGRLVADPPQVLAVRPTDVDTGWLVTIGPSGRTTAVGTGPADCTVSGRASDLYQWVWNRAGADAIAVDGDRSLLDRWREDVRIRWS